MHIIFLDFAYSSIFLETYFIAFQYALFLLRDNSKVLLQFEEGIEFTIATTHRMINNNSNVDVEKLKLNLKMNISIATAQRKTIIARLELNRTAPQSLIMSYQVKFNKLQLLTSKGGHHNGKWPEERTCR